MTAAQYCVLADALGARGVTCGRAGERAAVPERARAAGVASSAGPGHPSGGVERRRRAGGVRLACERLGPGPAVLRDYVKSMKHHWSEAAYIPDVADSASAWQVASRFRELRDADFTGGFVLRRWERSVPPRRHGPGGSTALDGSSARTPTPRATCRRISTCRRSPSRSGPCACRSFPPTSPAPATACGGSSSSATDRKSVV